MAQASLYLSILFLTVTLTIYFYICIKSNIYFWTLALVILFQSFLISIATILITGDQAISSRDLHKIDLGWPVNFVSQSHANYDGPLPATIPWTWEIAGPATGSLLGLILNMFFCSYLVSR